MLWSSLKMMGQVKQREFVGSCSFRQNINTNINEMLALENQWDSDAENVIHFSRSDTQCMHGTSQCRQWTHLLLILMSPGCVVRSPTLRLCDILWCRLERDTVELLRIINSDIIRMIKSRRMKWARYIARMGEKRNACKILVGKPGFCRDCLGSEILTAMVVKISALYSITPYSPLKIKRHFGRICRFHLQS
jgi:hypothetical protein